jgi:carbon storage regulator
MDMLVLSRKVGEKVVIGNDIIVTVVGVHGKKVRIGIEAPDRFQILRSELIEEMHEPVGGHEFDECEIRLVCKSR